MFGMIYRIFWFTWKICKIFIEVFFSSLFLLSFLERERERERKDSFLSQRGRLAMANLCQTILDFCFVLSKNIELIICFKFTLFLSTKKKKGKKDPNYWLFNVILKFLNYGMIWALSTKRDNIWLNNCNL